MGMRSQGLVNKKKTLRKSHSFRKKKLLMWSIELLEHRTLVFLEHVSNIWFILKKNMKKKVWLLIFSGDVQRLFIMWFTISPTYMVWGGLIQWIKDSVFTNSLFFFLLQCGEATTTHTTTKYSTMLRERARMGNKLKYHLTIASVVLFFSQTSSRIFKTTWSYLTSFRDETGMSFNWWTRNIRPKAVVGYLIQHFYFI